MRATPTFQNDANMNRPSDFSPIIAGFKRILLLLPLLCLVACSSVKIDFQDGDDYVTRRRSDYINSGKLSQQTITSLHVVGLEEDSCRKDREACIETVTKSPALTNEQRLSAGAELWLMDADILDKKSSGDLHLNGKVNEQTAVFSSTLEAARYAYAYLFYTDRDLGTRSLEARQHQIRDIYNYSTYSLLYILSELINECKEHELERTEHISKHKLGQWTIEPDLTGMVEPEEKDSYVTGFTPDYMLNFDGIRNQYEQDGIGAKMVLSLTSPSENERQAKADSLKQASAPVMDPEFEQQASPQKKEKHQPDKYIEHQPWEPMNYIAITSLLKFPGNNLEEVLNTDRVTLSVYDTWQQHDVSIGGHPVPLASNYTAAYGLWLANSDFSKQSLGTLFGKGNILEEPRVYLMQPYQPKLKTLILVHGLASSPEAWVNAANEIMGDEELRKHYQIWQVYYPTSAPIGINRYDIANALKKTFDHYDPQRKNPASKDVVIIGHSMGGILSRLLVSSSGETLWEAINKFHKIPDEKREKAWKKLAPYIYFKPMPEISRAVFLAAPHRGTPFADKSIARFIASLVKMPVTVLQKAGDVVSTVFGADAKDRPTMNGVDNLSAKDPSIQAFSKLEISPKVTFHSIMGNDTPNVPLAESSDGIVPYSSSHWDGAKSEVVIPSGHSVQETAQAIMEIRRILHEHLGLAPKSANEKTMTDEALDNKEKRTARTRRMARTRTRATRS